MPVKFLEVPLKVQVAVFLKEFKEIVTRERGLDVIDRRENLNALLSLGLTKSNCKHEILNLTVNDYCDGPKPDQDRPGEIWEFGNIIDGKEIYIKLKIAKIGTERIAKCISFHEARYPLTFPFK